MANVNYNPGAVTKLDMASMSPVQKELYLPLENEPQEHPAQLIPAFEKFTWSSHLPVKFEHRQVSNFISYSPPTNLHFLLYSTLFLRLPKVRVKKEYQDRVKIAWTYNLGINIINTGFLCFNNDNIQSIDYIRLNMFIQEYFKSENQRLVFDRMIGNIPQLQNWTTYLPPYPLKIPQLWFCYARNEGLAVPLFLLNEVNVHHKFDFRLKIADLIRMKFLDQETNQWVEKKCRFKYLDCKSNGTSVETLDIPELWGRFANIDEGEYNWWFEKDLKPEEEAEREYRVIIDDMMPIDLDDEKKYGDSFSIDIACEKPCRSINIVAENLTATTNNYYSNFTTCSENLFEGWNPVSIKNIRYGSALRVPELPLGFSDEIEYLYHADSIPLEPGYNKYSFSYKSSNYNDVAIIPKNNEMKMNLQITNYNLFYSHLSNGQNDDNWDDSDTEDETNKKSINERFKVRIRLVTMKLLKINKGKYTIDPYHHDKEVINGDSIRKYLPTERGRDFHHM